MKQQKQLLQGIRIYAYLLKLYPTSYQRRFSNEMLQTFSDQYKEEKNDAYFWLRTISDELKNITNQQFQTVKEGELFMQKYSFGLTVLGVMIIAIILTNIVFPNNASDDYPAVGLMYLSYFLSFGVTGFLSVKKKDSIIKGAKSGAILGLIVMVTMTITYLIIDNMFLDIVSKQPDKIMAFRTSGYHSMRESINFGLLKGLLFGSVVGSIFGGIFGSIGAAIKKYIVK